MALKLQFVIISAILLVCIDANAVCHLDYMKRFALHSCEHLIELLSGDISDNERLSRTTRDLLDNSNSSTGNYYDENRHVRPTHLRMQDRNFPAGGYIVLDHVYAKILRMHYPSTYHVIPKNLYSRQKNGKKHRHKLSDFNEMKNDIMYRRRKRNGHQHPAEGHNDKINFHYCCVHKCKPYDLCEL